MQYKVHLTNVDGIGKPSVIGMKAADRQDAITQFHRVERAHGDQSVLKLKLIEIDDSGKESEVPTT
jgi:hypothetical protein